jgi:hypothetical protein
MLPFAMHRKTSVLAAALLAATTAGAQLRPPGTSGQGLEPPLMRAPGAGGGAAAAEPAAPAASPNADKEKAGEIAAAGWLTLLDRRDWGTAWETSASQFRKAVPLDRWMDGAPKVRADFGALQERTPATVGYKTELPGQPKGEYVTVIFASKFAQKQVDEVVTTVRDSDGRWRVTGYSTR